MEKNNTFSLKLPFFPGFYNTIYDGIDTEYNVVENFKYDTDVDLEYNKDYTFDYNKYKEDVCKAFTESCGYYMPNFIKKVEFDELDSPEFYNYQTDRIYAFVTFNDNWEEEMKRYYNTYKVLLGNLIKQYHSSHSGFISYMSNNIEDWYDKLFNEKDTLYLEYFLQYIMLVQYFEGRKNVDLTIPLTDNQINEAYNYYANGIECDVFENIYEDSYMKLTENGISKCKENNVNIEQYSYFLA